MSTDELIARAVRLSRPDRTRLLQELLASLEEDPEAEIAQEWASELARRSHEMTSGAVQAIDWATARLELLDELKQRRDARTPS